MCTQWRTHAHTENGNFLKPAQLGTSLPLPAWAGAKYLLDYKLHPNCDQLWLPVSYRFSWARFVVDVLFLFLVLVFEPTC